MNNRAECLILVACLAGTLLLGYVLRPKAAPINQYLGVTRWEFDAIREFHRTNTSPFYWMPPVSTNADAIELGYRNDWVVVWRTPPEAMKGAK